MEKIYMLIKLIMIIAAFLAGCLFMIALGAKAIIDAEMKMQEENQDFINMFWKTKGKK